MRNLVRTLEIIYWGVAALVAVIVSMLAPWIASEWLNTDALSDDTIQHSIVLMGLMIALRMPYGFYGGGLLGLQRQVLFNAIKIAVESTKSIGVIIVLWLVNTSIVTFFQWQLLITGVGVALISYLLWRCLPGSERPRFDLSQFSSFWRFSAGMSIIAVLSVILLGQTVPGRPMVPPPPMQRGEKR